MAYKYCTECGHKVEYVGSLPKFCSSCGADMSGSVKSAKRIVKNSISSKKSELLGLDETDASSVPDIGSLQYTVEGFGSKTTTFGDVFGGANPQGNNTENAPNVQGSTEET